jgi:ADP-ribose pyrophosphatase YjhB (NUDIX family)
MNVEKPQTTRVAAYGLVLNEGRIVLCRISDELPEHCGKWTLPGGGIEFGEHPVDAMVREVREETGLVVRPTTLAGIDSVRIEREHQSFHSIRIVYHTKLISGSLTNEVDGTTDLCSWWSPDEAAELDLVDLAGVGLNYAYSDAWL